jgi:hypothetical protein
MRLQTCISWKSWRKISPRACGHHRVPGCSGRNDTKVRAEVLDALAAWIETVLLSVSRCISNARKTPTRVSFFRVVRKSIVRNQRKILGFVPTD